MKTKYKQSIRLAALLVLVMLTPACALVRTAYETVTGEEMPRSKPQYSERRPYAGAYGTRPTNAYDAMIQTAEQEMASSAMKDRGRR